MSLEPRAHSERRQRLIILGTLWIALGLTVVIFRSVLLPFAGAALIAYLVAPLVSRISGLRVRGRPVPRWVAILVIYVLFFAVVYLAIILLVPQLYRELARISKDGVDYLNSLTPERVQQLARAAETWLSEHGLPVELSSRSLEGAGAAHPHAGAWSLSLDLQQLINELAAKAGALLKENLGDLVTITRSIVGGVLSFVFMLFFVLMLGAYTSIDSKAIRTWLKSLVPPEYGADVKHLVERIDRSLAGVVRGQVTICLINGLLTFVGLMIFGVKFAFLLATVATLFSLIPIFGSIISSVPIVAIALSQSWQTALSALAWILGIHALEAYFLNPKIMGSAARIHPLVVAFALIAGERTFGLVGALFAVPVAAIAVGVFEFARLKAQPAPAVAAPIA
ncbi:MAG: AI-2E family transporter [Myxococcaceae bacterium]